MCPGDLARSPDQQELCHYKCTTYVLHSQLSCPPGAGAVDSMHSRPKYLHLADLQGRRDAHILDGHIPAHHGGGTAELGGAAKGGSSRGVAQGIAICVGWAATADGVVTHTDLNSRSDGCNT